MGKQRPLERWFVRIGSSVLWYSNTDYLRTFMMTVPGEFPAQRPVTRSFDVFFDLRLNKRLSKQPWGWWFETPAWSLWRHRNVNNMMSSWHRQISPLLCERNLCEGKRLVTGEFHPQMASDVDLWGVLCCKSEKKWLQQQSNWRWFQTPLDVTVMPNDMGTEIWSIDANNKIHHSCNNQLISPLDRIYASLNRIRIGSDNGLQPIRRQTIIWTNAVLASIGPLETNFVEILIKIQNISFTKMHMDISSAKQRPFCPASGGGGWWCSFSIYVINYCSNILIRVKYDVY